MVNCPACEAELDLDEDLLEEGGVLNCHECGSNFEVVNTHPLELDRIGEDDDDEDDDEDFDDEDDDDFDEDEDEDEDFDEDEDEDEDSELEVCGI